MIHLNNWLDSLKYQHKPSLDECIDMLSGYFPALNDFKITEQDSQWHAEGDVHIHTQMVLDSIYDLLDNMDTNKSEHILTSEERQVLILSALLHDIAKPWCTRRKVINGQERVVASGHEDEGRSYLATRIINLELSKKAITLILALVGEHQKPKMLVIKNKDYCDYFALSRIAPLHLFYYLEMADVMGRTCDDHEQQKQYIEMFKLFSQDYNLWNPPASTTFSQSYIEQLNCLPVKQQSYVYSHTLNWLANQQIIQAEEAFAKSYQARQDYAHIVILVGLSGSGKSTWVKQNVPEYEVISLDLLREKINGKRACQKNIGQILQAAKLQLKQGLAANKKLVWDATNLRRDFRSPIIQIAKDYQALSTQVVFQCTEQHVRKQNKQRQHQVPEDVLTQQLTSWQWPNVLEAHRTLVINNKGEAMSKHGDLNPLEQWF